MKQHYKKIAVGGVGILLWASALIAFAQTQVPAGTKQDLREKAQTIREETRTNVQGIRQAAKTSVQNVRKEIEAKREELKKQLEATREEAKKRVEAARETAKEAVKVKREELKKRLGEIKDERKKAAATRLDEQMNRLNERWTTHFTDVLDHLDDVLGKIQIRADKAVSLGKDVSAVKTAVDAAKVAIASARTAVETQAKKTYIATITSDAKLGEAFKSVRDQLHKDLTDLRDGPVKNARDAVQNAARSLGGVPKVDDEPEDHATTTPSSTSATTTP